MADGRGFAMAAAIGLRPDYDAAHLRALALIYDGGSRSAAAAHGAVSLQTVRDWVHAFNAGGPDSRVNGKAPGRPARLSEAHRQALRAAVEAGPIPAVHGVVRWRLLDLMCWLHDEFGVSLSKQTLS